MQEPDLWHPNHAIHFTQNLQATSYKSLPWCHQTSGTERSHSLLKDQIYWPNKSEELADYVKGCGRCPYFKTKMEKAPLSLIQVMHPLKLIHMYYLTIELGKGDEDINILVVPDQLPTMPRHTSPLQRRQEWSPKHYGRSSWLIMAYLKRY